MCAVCECEWTDDTVDQVGGIWERHGFISDNEGRVKTWSLCASHISYIISLTSLRNFEYSGISPLKNEINFFVAFVREAPQRSILST